MITVNLISGTLSESLEEFNPETQTPVIFESIDEAMVFVKGFVANAKPQRAIRSEYDIESHSRYEYDTILCYKAEIECEHIESRWLKESIESERSSNNE